MLEIFKKFFERRRKMLKSVFQEIEVQSQGTVNAIVAKETRERNNGCALL